MSPPAMPEGLTEADYDSIEAAVMETVRGRWFLSEFGRRTRAAELRQMLDAIGRLEHAVTNRILPPADVAPHTRLLAQRAADIARHLQATADGLRARGLDESLCSSLEGEARAVAALMRPAGDDALPVPPRPATPELPPPADPRLAALGRLDCLPLADKIALFA